MGIDSDALANCICAAHPQFTMRTMSIEYGYCPSAAEGLGAQQVRRRHYWRRSGRLDARTPSAVAHQDHRPTAGAAAPRAVAPPEGWRIDGAACRVLLLEGSRSRGAPLARPVAEVQPAVLLEDARPRERCVRGL